MSEETYKYLIYAVLITLNVILIARYLLKRSRDPFDPILFYPIIYLTYYNIGFSTIIDIIQLKLIALFLVGIIAYFGGVLLIYVSKRPIALEINYFYSSLRFYLSYALFTAVGLISTAYVFVLTGIPLFQGDINETREEISQHAYIATLGRLLSIAIIVGVSWSSKTKNKWLIIITLILFLSTILHGTRELPLSILLMATFYCNYNVKPIQRKALIKMAVVVLTLLVLISFYRGYALYGETILNHAEGGNSNVWVVGLDIASYYLMNEFSVSLINFSEFVNLIPTHVDYQYGRLFLAPLILTLPIKHEVPGAFIKKIIGGEWTGAGASSTLVGIFYADLGLAGVILGMFFVGALLKSLHDEAIHKPSSILWVGLYSYFLYNSITGLRSNFTQGFDVIFYPVLFLIFHMATISKKQIIGRSK